MTRTLRNVGIIAGTLLLAGLLLFFWASSEYRSENTFADRQTYSEAPVSPNQDTFTVMTYNVGQFKTTSGDEGTRAGNVSNGIELIRRARADVVAFQDLDFSEANSPQPLDTIASRLKYAEAARAITWNERYIPPFADQSANIGPTVSGLAILSKFPIRRQSKKALPRSRTFFVQDAFSPTPLAQIVAVGIGGWPLLIINAHLDASDVKAREKQARTLKELYARVARQGFPVLLMGDFNSPMPSALSALPREAQRTYADDKTMEILLDGTDLQPAISEGAYVTGRPINTYPAGNPTLKMSHLFYRPRLIVPVNAKTWCKTSSPPPSDHCALTMSFLLPRPDGELPEAELPDEAFPSLDSLIHR